MFSGGSCVISDWKSVGSRVASGDHLISPLAAAFASTEKISVFCEFRIQSNFKCIAFICEQNRFCFMSTLNCAHEFCLWRYLTEGCGGRGREAKPLQKWFHRVVEILFCILPEMTQIIWITSSLNGRIRGEMLWSHEYFDHSCLDANASFGPSVVMRPGSFFLFRPFQQSVF